MINFNKEKNIIHLYNDNISYIIYINSKKYLQHVYFGKRISDFDIESFLDLGWDWPKTYLGKDTNFVG